LIEGYRQCGGDGLQGGVCHCRGLPEIHREDRYPVADRCLCLLKGHERGEALPAAPTDIPHKDDWLPAVAGEGVGSCEVLRVAKDEVGRWLVCCRELPGRFDR